MSDVVITGASRGIGRALALALAGRGDRRLCRILERPRWSPPGEARWMFEEQEKPWFPAAEKDEARRAVREMTRRWLGGADRS